MNYFKDLVLALAPAFKAALIHGAKIGSYIVLSAALTAVAAYFEGKPMDPALFAIFNVALAAARKAIEALKDTTAAAVPYDPGLE